MEWFSVEHGPAPLSKKLAPRAQVRFGIGASGNEGTAVTALVYAPGGGFSGTNTRASESTDRMCAPVDPVCRLRE